MRIRLVLGVVGHMLRLSCLAYAIPFLLALRDAFFVPVTWEFRVSDDGLYEASHFFVALAAAFAVGTILERRSKDRPNFRRAEALSIVVGTWTAFGVFGAIPYLFAGLKPVDALFEAVSGFTTTGATVLTEWDQSRAFFLWRAMTQWFGGLGVIALFVVVLPRLGIAGRQILFAEASGAPSESVSPSVRRSARKLWVLYSALTLLQAAILVSLGMPLYHAFVHSLTTLSAGGFSPNPESMAAGVDYTMTPGMQWTFVPFMFIAGASYPLLWVTLTRRPLAMIRDGEFKLYLLTALIGGSAIAFLLAGGVPGAEEIRHAAFQVASLISSAGFASLDYEKEWGQGVKIILLVIMVVGGCAGSAAGGAKQVRFLLVLKFLRREITRVLHPRAVLPLRHGDRPVSNEVMRAVFTLVLLYIVGYVIVAVPVVLLGTDLETGVSQTDMNTGISAAVACLSNVGPAFGPAGPMGSYEHFPVITKLILIAAMLIGRLEIVTVLALLHPDVWTKLRWNGSGARTV